MFIANLALQYNNIGRTDEAIKFLTEALRYDKINSNEVQKAVIYTNLGILSKENTKDYSQAIGYFNKSLSIYQKLNDKRLTAQTLNKLGNTLLATLPPDTSIALRHLNKALLLAHEVKDIRTISSITYAKRIQNAILPPIKTIETVFANSFVLYSPKDIVSGDFYWLEESGNKIHFAVADCTGHGVPGAMVSVICNNGLNRSVREHNLVQPNQILDKTREIIIKEFEKSGENIKDGMDISLINIDKTNNLLEFSGAHNSAWIIRKKENSHQLIELKGDKQPVGNFEKYFPFNNQHFNLLKGDTIYLYSDGYADQFGGPKNKKIKSVNFKKLLLEIQDLDLKIQKEKLQTFFIDWKGDYEQLDDVCVVGIRI